MSIIDRVTAHFEAGLGEARQFIDVPEWGGEDGKPLRVFWSPVTVLEQRSMLGAKPGVETKVSVLLAKAEDESGRKLFDPKDRAALMTKADAGVITRVVNAILADDAPEEAEKN